MVHQTLFNLFKSISTNNAVSLVIDGNCLLNMVVSVLPQEQYLGGEDPSGESDEIDYVEFGSKGNAADFGNLTAARRALAGLSSDTK